MQSQAIIDRDARILTLEDQLAAVKQELEQLKSQVADLRAQRDTLAREIMMLEERLSTTVKPRVSRGTNPPKLKTKEKEQQTDIDLERAAMFD